MITLFDFRICEILLDQVAHIALPAGEISVCAAVITSSSFENIAL